MQIVITDVTNMSHGTCCVAGWSSSEQRMIRPLPGGQNWSTDLVRKHAIAPGAVIAFDPSTIAYSSDYPHRTEDLPVVESSIQFIRSRSEWWLGERAVPAAHTLQEAFGGKLLSHREWDGARKGVYVATGEHTRSLWGIHLPLAGLRFIEDGVSRLRLRGIVNDVTEKYDVAVSSLALQDLYEREGLDAVRKLLPSSGSLHVRVGLARAWDDQPEECSVMINGVFW